MLPQNKTWRHKFVRKKYDCADAKYNKYGKEIPVSDYVQGGKSGTIAKEIIERAGGFDVIKAEAKKLPDAPITVDMNMDLLTVNRMLKVGKIAQERLNKMAEKKLNEMKQTKAKEKNE